MCEGQLALHRHYTYRPQIFRKFLRARIKISRPAQGFRVLRSVVACAVRCVVTCVITSHARQPRVDSPRVTRVHAKGSESASDQHAHRHFRVTRSHWLSRGHNSLREMAWKRSSVLSRPGPPILDASAFPRDHRLSFLTIMRPALAPFCDRNSKCQHGTVPHALKLTIVQTVDGRRDEKWKAIGSMSVIGCVSLQEVPAAPFL
jgi:hypothetical protein